MKQAWLVVNAFLHSDSFVGMEKVLLDSAREAGIHLTRKTNADFIRPDSLVGAPAAALFFDKDLRLAKRMEMAGLRLLNSEAAIGVCDDKTLTTLVLEQAGIAQPKTILSPKSYPGVGYDGMAFLQEVAAQLAFPLVVKEGKGSFGQQVYLAHTMAQLKQLLSQFGDRELLFQHFVRETAGKDLRLYVVGGEVVAAIRRQNNEGDFRANLANGSTAHNYTPTAEETRLALASCAACKVDFAGVDLLQSKQGPLVCEVNSNAHFLGLMEVTGVNPARAIMRLLKEAL